MPVYSELILALSEHRVRLDATVEAVLRRDQQRLKSLASHRALAGPAHLVAMRKQRLDELQERLEERLTARITQMQGDLRLHRMRLSAVGLQRRTQRVDERLVDGTRHLARALRSRLDVACERLASSAGRLEALSPLGVIARGYSVITSRDGLLVRRLAQAVPGTPIQARVEDGWLQATVVGQRQLKEQERPLGDAEDSKR